MIYKSGTVNVVQGSKTITGLNTEFLKYASKGGYFKRQADSEFYVIVDIPSNTSLTLNYPYAGSTGSNVAYAITMDQTPNLGLPLINANDPDATQMVNTALSLIDKQAGIFLDFQTLKSVTYSGEGGFFIRGKYHTNELMEGRVVKFIDSSGELSVIDIVQSNKVFEASINTTPVDSTVAFDASNSGEYLINKWDIVVNTTRDNYVFLDSVAVLSGELIYSGEFQGNSTSWGDNDVLKVYSSTMGLAQIDTGLTSVIVPLTAVSGESLDVTEFKNGDYVYNYERDTYRVITSGETATLQTEESTDTWAEGDTIYTVRSDIKTQLANLGSSIASIQYGARSNIGTDSVKAAHADFGLGSNQIHGGIIPVLLSGISGETVSAAISEVYGAALTHINSGEGAHAGTAISFVDDGSVGTPIISTNLTDAVNELKTRINNSSLLEGVVDDSDNNWSFIDISYDGYPTAFFNTLSGEWYCRFESGPNIGELSKLIVFNPVSGEFTFTSGESFTYTLQEGDKFKLIHLGS